MKKDENELKSEKILKGMADFIAEGQAKGANREDVEAELRESGIDPKSYMSSLQAIVDKGLAEHRAAIRSSRLKAESKLATVLAKIKDRLARLTPAEEQVWFGKLEPQFAFFRNFKSLSPADRITMLEDAELLAKLEEIMDEEDSKW